MSIVKSVAKALYSLSRPAQSRADSWGNPITYQGSGYDRITATRARQMANSRQLLDEFAAAYRCDDITRKIVGALPEDSLKDGFTVLRQDGSELEVDGDKAADFERALRLADNWGRREGLGAIWPITNVPVDVPLSEGVSPDVQSLRIISKRQLTPHSFYEDPTHAKFGLPETWRFEPRAGRSVDSLNFAIIHETHLVVIGGLDTDWPAYVDNDFADDSVLLPVWRTLQGFASAWMGLENMAIDPVQNVIKVMDLYGGLMGQDPDTQNDLEARLSLMDQMRSSSRSIFVDAENEDFARHGNTFGGVPDVMDRFFSRVAAAAGMPVTRLWGTSAAGMNATGEGDARNWASQIETHRRQVLDPAIKEFHLKYLGEEVEVKWPPAFQPTALEEAQINKMIAETDAINTGGDIIYTGVEASKRYADGRPSLSLELNLEPREAVEDKEIEELLSDKPEPNPGFDGANPAANGAAAPAVLPNPGGADPRAADEDDS